MEWIFYSTDKTIRLKGNAKKIIERFGEFNDQFFTSDVRPERTRFVKKLLVKLGHELKYKVYANRLSSEDLLDINQPFINREWLFDIHWYSESGPYSVDSLPLAVECEWNPKRKGDSKIPYSGIKYDFQKLVVTNAELRLMILKIKRNEDLSALSEYFEKVISNYKQLEGNAQFLFVAFDEKAKGFHFKEIITSKKSNK